MSTNDIVMPSAAAAPDRIGQATAIEQSRAIAEVQGAILVAQRCPRDVPGAITAMQQSCNQKHLADRAFFAVPRGGGTVNGATVHLARELVRVWGNVQYGVSEMRRDDVHGQSEMMAFAWDVQTNTRVETKFVVPHMRDRKADKGGPVRLTSMDDIYTSNANAGARRVRECIFSILPPWFVEEAKALCHKTLEHGGGKPLEQRIASAIQLFEEMDIVADQLERRVGRPPAKWTARDVAQLSVAYQSLTRGEMDKDEEFPPIRVTGADIVAASTHGRLNGVPMEPTPAPAPASVPSQSDIKITEQTGVTGEDLPGPGTAGLPDITPFVPDEDVPRVLAELGLKAEAPGQSNGAAPQEDDKPTEGGPKASKALVAAVKTLLADNDVTETADQRAVVSFLSGERVPMLADLTDTEARYLLRRIPELAEKGTFPDTVARARAVAKS